MNKIFFFLLILIFLSCKKEEGYGGLAEISGKVFAKDYNSSGIIVREGYLGGQKVYIAKHGETVPFDDVDTGYDGAYRFNFLEKGHYDLWVFGDCDYCPGWDQVYFLKSIEITSEKQDAVLEDFIISI